MDKTSSIELATEIVSAFVSNNSVPRAELASLLETVHSAVERLTTGAPTEAAPEPVALVPAVPIRKSVTPDFVICLEDGKKFRSMRRHLKGLGMTPEQYRQKWNLPSDYPMVAPNYSTKRSAMAKELGLGQKRPALAAAKKAGKTRPAV